MINFSYFASGILGAIAFSNLLALITRNWPAMSPTIGTFLGLLLAIGLGGALLQDDPEFPVRIWFAVAFSITLGVFLGGL